MEAITPYGICENKLAEVNAALQEKFSAECIFINSAMLPPLDDELRVVIESLTENDNGYNQERLVVLLQTRGGLMETVERLVSVMREQYKIVSFVIPNYAYSAGTVLVLSGDEIYMDYYSVLGPIDPQFTSTDNRNLPGFGYLAKFKELVDIINNSTNPKSRVAELSYLIEHFEPAKLFAIEQNIAQGISLIKKWLPTYKFKNWNETITNKEPVTDDMKKKRAENIARTLGNAEEWHSHGRGITMSELTGEKIKLKIEDFGADSKLSSMIRNYHGLAISHYAQIGVRDWIHSRLGHRRVA